MRHVKNTIMSKSNDFRKLHAGNKPFIIGNVWNAKSARIAEKAGYKALGISGHAIAENLGYGDGEEMSFEELTFIVKRVIQSVSIPVSVDIDGGYGRDSRTVNQNIEKLLQMGAAGINIEDSVMKDGKRQLVDPTRFAKIIRGIRTFLSERDAAFFVNLRVDTYITKQEQPLDETLKRIKKYEDAGADGVFVPFLTDQEEIRKVVQSTSLPLNVYLRPNFPAFEVLAEMGVKRISYGTAVYLQSYAKAEELFQVLLNDKRFERLFA